MGNRSSIDFFSVSLPVSRGYLYLVAIMDWATRKVLSWRVSNTMHADFCVDALNEAIEKYGPPEIMNTDSKKIKSVSGRRDSNTDRPSGRLLLQGALVWLDPHSD